MAGMPMEAVEGAAAPAVEGLIDTFKGAWQNIRPHLKGLSNMVGEAEPGAGGAIQGLKGALSDMVPGGNGMMPEPIYNSMRQPKVGGVLHDVLSRGAEAQGAGQDVSPGTQRLLQHFAGLIR